MPGPDIGLCSPAVRLGTREESRGVGRGQHRRHTVRIKRTERDGLLGGKVGKVGDSAGYPDTDEIANSIRSRRGHTDVAAPSRRTPSARCRSLRRAFHATCTALARWARSIR